MINYYFLKSITNMDKDESLNSIKTKIFVKEFQTLHALLPPVVLIVEVSSYFVWNA